MLHYDQTKSIYTFLDFFALPAPILPPFELTFSLHMDEPYQLRWGYRGGLAENFVKIINFFFTPSLNQLCFLHHQIQI